jgi:hypothetical protein
MHIGELLAQLQQAGLVQHWEWLSAGQALPLQHLPLCPAGKSVASEQGDGSAPRVRVVADEGRLRLLAAGGGGDGPTALLSGFLLAIAGADDRAAAAVAGWDASGPGAWPGCGCGGCGGCGGCAGGPVDVATDFGFLVCAE